MITERMQQLAGVEISESVNTKKLFNQIKTYQKRGKDVFVFHSGNQYRGNLVDDLGDWFDGNMKEVLTSTDDGTEEWVSTNQIEWFEVDSKRYSVNEKVQLSEAKTKTIKVEAQWWDNQDRWFIDPHTWTVVIDTEAGTTEWASKEKKGFGTVKHDIDIFKDKKNSHHGMFMIEMRKTVNQSGFVGLDKKNLAILKKALGI